MTVFVRIMEVAADGGPVVGDQGCQLGARHPGTLFRPGDPPTTDISADAKGMVHPGKKGMSLFLSTARLPPHLLTNPRIAGQLAKFEINDDPYPTQQLHLHVTNQEKGHGVMSPATTMTLSGYQNALASTRPDWRIAS